MDIIDIAIAKAFATKVAAGFSKVEVDGMTINFTLNDGTITSLTVPTPADGVSVTDINIDENGNLICTMSDETEINAGKITPTKGVDYYTPEEIEEVKTEISTELQEEIDLLNSNFESKSTTLSDNITLTDSANGRIKKIAIVGKTKQDTTSISEGDEYDSPSPDHTQPLNNVEGNVITRSSNKNVFSPLAYNSSDNTYGIIRSNANNSSEINISGTSTNTANISIRLSGNFVMPVGSYNIFVEGMNTADWINVHKNGGGNFVTSVRNGVAKSFIIDETQSCFIQMIITPNTSYDGTIKILITSNTGNLQYIPHQGKSIIFPLAEGQKMYEGDYLANDGIHHTKKQLVMNGTETLALINQRNKLL